MLTDKKKLEILLEILDQDIEATLNLFEDKGALNDLDVNTIGRAILLIAPSLKECRVDAKDLTELVKERVVIMLKKMSSKTALSEKKDAPEN